MYTHIYYSWCCVFPHPQAGERQLMPGRARYARLAKTPDAAQGISIYLSLSLSIYIYIYMYIHCVSPLKQQE